MKSNPYNLDEIELERHAEAQAAGTAGFGAEASIQFFNGFSIRTPAYPDNAIYVRVCAPDGVEIAYFDEAEFVRDASGSLGALIGHLDRGPHEADLVVNVLRDAGSNPYRLMPGEIIHRDAVASGDNDYGNEIILTNVANGFGLAASADSDIDYVRICDPDGGETAYWSVDEFSEDPSDVIGAMFGAMVRGK